MRLTPVGVALIAVQVTDVLTTVIVVGGGGSEVGPLVTLLDLGWPAILIVKAVATAALVVVCGTVKRQSMRPWLWLWPAAAAVPVVMNLAAMS